MPDRVWQGYNGYAKRLPRECGRVLTEPRRCGDMTSGDKASALQRCCKMAAGYADEQWPVRMVKRSQ